MGIEIIALLVVVPAFIVWVYMTFQKMKLKKEIKRLKEHLHTKMEIDAEGNQKLKKELEELRKQNENLRITNNSLKSKPGRSELLLLCAYDKAIHDIIAKNPSFAPMWEELYQKSENEIKEIDSGVRAYISRMFRRTPTIELSSATMRLLEKDKDKGSTDE